MPLESCGRTVPVVASCPSDTEQILFFNSEDSSAINGMVLRTYATLKNCLLQSIFGTGALEITGANLNGAGEYFNSDLINNLFVFACNIPNYLIETTQFEYILDGGSNVIGVRILIGYDPADRFIIIPNPIPS